MPRISLARNIPVSALLLLQLVTTSYASWFGGDEYEYESERLFRSDFVRAMQEAEEAHMQAMHRKSLTERILALAEKVVPGRRMNEDQYFKYEDVNDWNAVENLAGMAIKYTGCQNIKRWDDNLAANGETPLVMDRFVMFRLCDADSCSAYNKWGCNSNYGEYVIPMEDYLSLMAEYHFQQFGRYCKTCYQCSKLDYYNPQAQQDDGDDQAVEEDDYVNITEAYPDGDDAWNGYRQYWYEPDYWGDDGVDDDAGYNRHQRRAAYYQQGGGAANYYYGEKGYNFSYGDYNGNKWYQDQDTGKCIFEEVCSDYRGACKAYNPNATFYESYFTCSQFNVGNNIGYLAPHCRNDGHTIGIGMYSDEYCTDFIGDESDVAAFTGKGFDDGELSNYYDKTCISCQASEGFSLITDDALGSNTDLTYPLCSVLYESSAKCNKYVSDALSYNDDEFNQEMNEEEVCDFLNAMNMHSYNEYGQIYRASNDLGEWFDDPRASTPQKMMLLMSMAAFVFMSVYSIYLTKKLFYRKPWRPPRNVHSPYSSGASGSAAARAVAEAGRVSRANSGIIALRSEDNGSYFRESWGDNVSQYQGSSKMGTFA